MIQPNELRLNNWVLNYKGEYKQIKDICEDGSVWLRCNLCVKAKYRHKLEGLNPIPLTEERLIKLSAEKHTPDNTYKLDGIIIDLKLGIAMLDCENCTPLLGMCKYLHQLQNIYFIRKNQELEIEL